jgi:hypothetical protein
MCRPGVAAGRECVLRADVRVTRGSGRSPRHAQAPHRTTRRVDVPAGAGPTCRDRGTACAEPAGGSCSPNVPCGSRALQRRRHPHRTAEPGAKRPHRWQRRSPWVGWGWRAGTNSSRAHTRRLPDAGQPAGWPSGSAARSPCGTVRGRVADDPEEKTPMCQRVVCRQCGKPTWSGCGKHVEDVLRDVPPAQRCQCERAKSWLDRLLGR